MTDNESQFAIDLHRVQPMSSHGCKVCRVLSERDLTTYDTQLLAQWQGENGPRKGYRTLAEQLNIRLLQREMDRAGLPTIGGETESKYQRLTGDDSTTAAAVREMFRHEGVPIDEIEHDFVSYGVLRTHITECLGGEYTAPESDSDWETDAITIAQRTAKTKATEAIRALTNKGKLASVSEPVVDVDIIVECPECQSRISADKALRRGFVCTCAEPTDSDEE